MMAWLAGKFTIVGVLPSIIMANHLSLWKTINNLSIIADMWGIFQQTIELMIATRGCYSQLGWGITSGIWSNLTDGNHGCYTPKHAEKKREKIGLARNFSKYPIIGQTHIQWRGSGVGRLRAGYTLHTSEKVPECLSL
jgi:hypothetical protein